MTMLKKFYVLLSIAMIAFYAVAEINGWDFPTEKRTTIPPDVRSSPGGYRSYHFWHSGYHGGK
jgi:hypothetical protein